MISETIWYLQSTHGSHVLDAWLSDSTRREIARGDTLLDKWRLVDREAELVMSSLGVPFSRRTSRSVLSKGGNAFEYNGASAGPFDVSGYEYLTSVSAYPARDKGTAVGDSLVLRLSPDSSEIRIMRDSTVVLAVTIDSAIARASRDSVQSPIVAGTVRLGSTRPPERPPLVIDADGGGVRVRLFLTNLSAIRRDGVWRIQYFHGNLLLSTGAGLPKP